MTWFRYCNSRYTERTVEYYRDCLAVFNKFLAGRDLTQDSIEDYINTKYLDGWCHRTINANLTAIKSYCKWRSAQYGLENPASNIPLLREDPPKQRILSLEEFKKVLDVAHGKAKDMIVFVANTGVRLSELNKLRWSNISPDFRFVTIIGKGRKVRVVPLNSACRKILSTYQPDGGLLPFAYPEYRSKARFVCHSLARKAGVDLFGTHALRHLFATQLARQGVGIYKISKLLGHSSVTTTEQIYVHIAAADLDGSTDDLFLKPGGFGKEDKLRQFFSM